MNIYEHGSVDWCWHFVDSSVSKLFLKTGTYHFSNAENNLQIRLIATLIELLRMGPLASIVRG